MPDDKSMEDVVARINNSVRDELRAAGYDVQGVFIAVAIPERVHVHFGIARPEIQQPLASALCSFLTGPGSDARAITWTAFDPQKGKSHGTN